MPTLPPTALSLTSEWFVRPGQERHLVPIIARLVADIHAGEPDTLIYFVHQPLPPRPGLQSLPPPAPNSLLFFEVYRNEQAFHDHVNGAIFTRFVADHGDLFIQSNGRPFTFVEFLHRVNGFVRAESPSPPTHSLQKGP